MRIPRRHHLGDAWGPRQFPLPSCLSVSIRNSRLHASLRGWDASELHGCRYLWKFSATREYLVGVAGFEPATPSSRTCAVLATLISAILTSTTFVRVWLRDFCPRNCPRSNASRRPLRDDRDRGARRSVEALDRHAEIVGEPPRDRCRPASPRSPQCAAARVASPPPGRHRRAFGMPCLVLTGLPFHSTRALAEPLPAPQMREQPIGQRDRRLAFLRLPLARRAAIEHALFKIDPSPALGRLERRAADRARPRAGVEPDQDEARDVPAIADRSAWRSGSRGSPCRPQQPRRLGTREPSLACRPAFGQTTLDNPIAWPSTPMMS